MPEAQVSSLLQIAVEALGGTERAGQVEMANAVAAAMTAEEHLLVQAGTGTGKSLAYLIPAFAHSAESGRPVVVATATLALQAQLVGRDLPNLVEAIGPHLEREPTYAIFKGRHNYACLHRVRDGVPDDQGALIDAPPTGPVGRQVLALREWADKQAKNGGSGDRDEAPTHQDRAWAQVSVSARECMGERCAYAQECFSERARNQARTAELVVTNHALLAIDAIELEEPIDTIAVGEIQTVTIPLSEQPPIGQNVPITVEVQPVPGEEMTDNNIQEFTVIFTR
jgi:ATP-dependent DNA helicase DinG